MNLTNIKEDVSIIVPLYIVCNDEHKYSIAVISLSYIMKHLPNKTLYVYETSEDSCFVHMKIYKKFEIEYFTNKSKDGDRYAESLNDVIDKITTKVFYIYDVDLFLPTKTFITTNMLVQNGLFDVVRPYNKYDKGVCIDQKEKFNVLSDILSNDVFCISEYKNGDKHGSYMNSCKILCVNKDRYCALKLPVSFLEKDEEDIHKLQSFYKKEFNVGFFNDMYIYYFEEKVDQNFVKRSCRKSFETAISVGSVSSVSHVSKGQQNQNDCAQLMEEDCRRPVDRIETTSMGRHMCDIKKVVQFEETVPESTTSESEDFEPDEMDFKNDISMMVYESYLEKIIQPNMEKCIFAKSGNNKLGVCLIEFRKLEWLRYLLFQIAHVYGGEDVSLYIVHGNRNERFLRNMLKGWKHVTFIKYEVDNIDKYMYANLCTQVDFYESFKTRFILKLEWDAFLRKKIPDQFFSYSYVGAPWNGFPNDFNGNVFNRIGNKTVGNGGFSLRRVDRMIEVCRKFEKPDDIGEDVHISNCLPEKEIPVAKEAKDFSVEHIYSEDPVGLHHVWEVHSIDKISQWFTRLS